MNPNRTFFFLTAALVSLLWLPYLLTQGMFMDGVINAIVAMNIADGIGSFFHPQGYAYPDASFFGHPPLAFYLQSLFFRCAGSGFFIEKIYSLITALLQLLLLTLLWRHVVEDKLRDWAWLPLVFFVLSPLTAWCYSNNLLENTMAVFTTASLLALVMYNKQRKYLFLRAAVSGLALSAALLCKGPVGLFVLAAPFLLLTIHDERRWKPALLYTAAMLLMAIVPLFILTGVSGTHHYFKEYIRQQIQPAVMGNENSFICHLVILRELLLALLVPMIFWLILKWRFRDSNLLPPVASRWLMLACCASLPIMISAKQSKFYLLPSMPVFAMALSLAAIPAAQQLVMKIPDKWHRVLRLLSAVLIALSFGLGIAQRHKIARDEAMLHDIVKIAAHTPDKVIGADWNLADQWALKAYLYRYEKIRLCFPTDTCPSAYRLDRNLEAHSLYWELVYRGETVHLYRRK